MKMETRIIQCLSSNDDLRESLTGKMGHLLGMSLYTDAYLPSGQQLLSPNEAIFVGTSLSVPTDTQYLGLSLT
jgi:hypothetical protein